MRVKMPKFKGRLMKREPPNKEKNVKLSRRKSAKRKRP